MSLPLRCIPTRIGAATEVPIQYFLDFILPPLHPEVDVDKVLGKLRRYGKKPHRAITKAGRWWGFSVDPAEMKGSRNAFHNLPHTIDAIARCGASKGMTLSLRLLNNPNPGRDADDYSERTLPDAYMVAHNTCKHDAQWVDIAVIGEYEKYASDKDDNISKITRSISRAFKDPRRRFVFGYTVEDVAMRLWFCDRTQFIASTHFNFITEHKTLIHAFLSLLYAEPHHLGWDPSIKMVGNVENGLQYDFVVERADGSTACFRSLESISEAGSKMVLGKGTRVWKAVPLINGLPSGEPVVLKDEWVQEELGREGTVLLQIQHSDDSEDFQRMFSANFLTVVSHGDVIMHSQMQAPYCDRTRQHIKNVKAFLSDISLPDPSLFAPRSLVPARLMSVGDPHLTGCRVHYRIVFKEYCRPLKLSTPLSVVFPALSDTCEALKVMHQAGWVHRDISVGNIMLDVSDHAKLVDLEYAKRMGDETAPELQVGTAPFVSAEVAEQVYWCTVPSPPSHDMIWDIPVTAKARWRQYAAERSLPVSSSNSSDSSFEYERRLAAAAQQELAERINRTNDSAPVIRIPASQPKLRTPSPKAALSTMQRRDSGFRYNPLHDLESLFWVTAYFLFNTTSREMDAGQVRRQEQVADSLFYDEHQHSAAIRLNGAFRNNLDVLPPDVLKLGLLLDAWRTSLTAKFYAAEKEYTSITSLVGTGLYEDFMSTLHKMAELAKLQDDSLSRTTVLCQKRALEELHTHESQATSTPSRPAKRARTRPSPIY